MYAQGMESKRGGEGRGENRREEKKRGEEERREKRGEEKRRRREEREERRRREEKKRGERIGLLTPCSPLLSIESAPSCCSPHT